MKRRRAAGVMKVRTAAQVRALSGPLPHRITAAMERLGPCTVREVAGAIDEPPESLYYHIRRLHRLGLLRERGRRRSGANEQAVYELPGRVIVYDPRNTSKDFLAALRRSAAALLRATDRMWQAALGHPATRRAGRRRNLMIQHHYARLNARDLAELNQRLEAIARFVHERDDPAAGPWLSLTMVMSPVIRPRQEDRR